MAGFFGLGVFALILLSTFDGGRNNDELQIGQVAIWGTLEGAAVNLILDELTSENEAYADVSYREVSEDSFTNTLINALADGTGPDLLLLSHEQLVELRRRITPISYESFSVRDIRSTYVDGAEIFALSDGLYAYPVAVDPLMMYWNRNLFSSKNLLSAPTTWESLIATYAPALTERDFDRTITKSAIAMGEYQNVKNAYGIISTLLLQSGSRLVEEAEGNRYDIFLDTSVAGGRPLVSTIDFYTRFSRPTNTLYSWNRSFGQDRQVFLAEDLAMYFGYGSEGKEIERLNPNLSFDIAEVPQGASATVRRTYGKFYGLAVLRNARNPNGAALVLSVLASEAAAAQIATANDLVPAHRNQVALGSNDTYGRLTYRSAAVARGWLNPVSSGVDSVFANMMREVVEGRAVETSAASDAEERLQLEYN